jgi:hypothetical protein
MLGAQIEAEEEMHSLDAGSVREMEADRRAGWMDDSSELMVKVVLVIVVALLTAGLVDCEEMSVGQIGSTSAETSLVVVGLSPGIRRAAKRW